MNDGLALAEMMRSGARTPCAVMQAAIDRAAASRDLGAVRFVDAAHGMRRRGRSTRRETARYLALARRSLASPF